jgi:hypothetical protein
MADQKVKFVLDLDVKEFTEKGLQAKGVIEKIADKEGLSELVEGLVHTTAVLGTVAAAAWAFKEAIDLTLEAEQIKRVENQFQTLANTAGISGKELKEGLESASGGLVTTGELLESANKSIVAMGSQAQRLPEVMEVARKATAVFGGDLKQNFESLSTAMANGNARMLKQYGIIVDTEKAVKEFAKTHNLAANEVSEMGRKQAIMNAALEQAKKAYQGVDDDLNTSKNTILLLKNTLSETAEVFTLAFEKTFGPTVRNFLVTVKDMAVQARRYLTGEFGEGLEKNKIQIEDTESQLTSLKNQLFELQTFNEGEGFFERLFKGKKEDRITKINADIEQTTKKLEDLKRENDALAEQEDSKSGRGPAGADPSEDIARKEVMLANETKFQAQMLALKKQMFDYESQNIQNLDDLDALSKERQFFLEQEHAQKVAELKANENLNNSQRMALLDMENKRYQASARAEEQKTAQLRMQLLDQYVKNSTSAFQGIGRAFQVMAMKNKAAMSDFGKRGEEITSSFQMHSTYAFQKMGQDMVEGKNIAEAAADAMKGFFLNMIADRAIAEGSMLLLSGIWPPNPLALGAGAGLVALGGALRTLAGGSAGKIAGATGGGPGVSGGYGVATEPKEAAEARGLPDPTTSEQGMPDMAANQRTQRTVNVQIAGNYFDTDTSRRQLMEMIRQETDATDFRYDRIGVG